MIYMDHAGTTPTRPEVWNEMSPFITETFGNPSSVHQVGQKAKAALEEARGKVASLVGAMSEEIYFTSGATESNNWAIKGVAEARASAGNHIVASPVEHSSVLNSLKYLASRGYRVTYLPVDEYGVVQPDDVQKALTHETTLVCVMHANNEVGTIQPIDEIGRVVKEHSPASFMVDAVQTIGVLPIDVRLLDVVDILTFSSHKFYGPKASGGLFLRKGTRAVSFMHGGEQERGKRAGTVNVAGAVGTAKALELAYADREEVTAREQQLRDRLIQGIRHHVPLTILTGHPKNRLPGNASFCFDYIEGESLIMNLDLEGICASTGSTCSTGTLEPSHVLLAMQIPLELALGSARFSLGRLNTSEEVEKVLEVLPKIVDRLRKVSPVYTKMVTSN